MALPLAPLLGSAAMKLIGSQSIRAIAAQEAFNLADNLLAKNTMPHLGEPLAPGSNFIPSRLQTATTIGSNLPGMAGSLMGKADIMLDIASKAMESPTLSPMLKTSFSTVKGLCEKFLTDQNATSLLEGLKDVQPKIMEGSAAGSQTAELIGGMIDKLFNGMNTYPSAHGPSPH